MKKIKKFKEVEEVTGFNAGSLEQETEEIIGLDIKTSEEVYDEKETEKVKKSKIEKFESFITINIDNVEKMEVEGEVELEDDEFDSEYEEEEGCGCCGDCSGQPGCYCGCDDCKCGEMEVEIVPISQVLAGVSESLKWHLDNNKPVTENIFRPGSEAFFEVIKEARRAFDLGGVNLSAIDRELFESTDIGKFAKFNGEIIPLDLPMEYVEEMNEAEYKGKEVKLNYPMRNTGSGKKYYVYVKNPKSGKVKKISFGDVKGGLTAKISNPKARRAFSARHGCDTRHKDKTKAGYWSCRLNKFGHLFGGRTYPGFW